MKNLSEASQDSDSASANTNWTSIQTYKGHHGIINYLLVYKDLLFSASDDMTARSWDVEKAERIHMFRGASGPVSALAADSGAIFGASEDGMVRAWDVSVRDVYLKLCFSQGKSI
jgi:WD40 repeat protein